MPDTDAVLAQINQRLQSIDKHLERINGRVGEVEKKANINDKNIAVITTRCQYLTHGQDDDIQRIEARQLSTEEKLLDFIKKNGMQGGMIGALLYVIGKVSGWW